MLSQFCDLQNVIIVEIGQISKHLMESKKI